MGRLVWEELLTMARIKDWIIDQQNEFDDTDYGYREDKRAMREYAQLDPLHYAGEEVNN